ncbi:hypothetical protein ERO13_D01G027950v2 [Gossypium hirsutum]|nr:hypothetical protein ERO13_D01G027950v2 [Gossypium hirsutum]
MELLPLTMETKPCLSIHSLSQNHLFQNHSSLLSRQDLKGRTVAACSARGASVVGIDQDESLSSLEHDPSFMALNSTGFKTVLGNFDWNLLKDADVVVVSPGVPLEKYGLSYLLQSGKQVMSELDFAAEALPKSVKILAVTGTNGKSTTVTFAGQMLNHFGIDTFAAIQHVTSPAQECKLKVAVVEVSSYQMAIPCVYFRPSVSVVLNLTPDHLERHKTMLDYAEHKCRLFSHMTNAKLGLLSFGNQHLDEAVKKYWNKFNPAWIGAFPGLEIDTEAKIATFKVPDIGIESQLQLGSMRAMGKHNFFNAAVAALSVAGLDVGVHIEDINSTIEKLRPPPHRMQVGYSWVTWVDDSKATNVEATYAGLMGLKGQKSVILLGGLAKVLVGQASNGFEELIEPLMGHRCVITFGASGTMIHQELSDYGLDIPCIQATNLRDAVEQARKMAKHGDAIVLSPACASFDEFRNFEHRGIVFRELALSS